jgi:hypothetical protein
MPTLRTDRPAELRQDLTLGLHAVTEFNQSIRFADTKAAALAALQALAITVLSTDGPAARNHLLPVALFGACLLGVLTSALLLAMSQAPRVTRHPARKRGRVSFPRLSAMPLAEVLRVPNLAGQREEVWRQALELSAIAMTKYRWLHRSAVSTFATLALVLLWLALTRVAWS